MVFISISFSLTLSTLALFSLSAYLHLSLELCAVIFSVNIVASISAFERVSASLCMCAVLANTIDAMNNEGSVQMKTNCKILIQKISNVPRI